MAMKKLQNNFTTPEQSKRLLELGVPDDSADMFYDMSYRPIMNVLPDGIKFSKLCANFDSEIYEDDDFLPCWSVGRLIEIFIICTPFVEIRLRTRLIEQLIASYEDVIKQGLIDFSKLEE